MIFLGLIWWVWLIDIAAIAGLGFLVYNEWPGASLGWLIVIGGSALWLTGYDFQPLIDDPLIAVGYVALYLLVGLVWAIAHWSLWTHSEEQRELIRSAHERWNKSTSIYSAGMPVADEDRGEFHTSTYFPYSWRKNHKQVMTWAVFWPIDAVLYLCSDFFYSLLTFVGHWFEGLFGAIARGAANAALRSKE